MARKPLGLGRFVELMPERKVAPFGSWTSPISPTMVSKNIELSEVLVTNRSVYWVETRPEQHGRRTIVAHEESNADVTSTDFDVGTRVHEYGGGSYAVYEGQVFFSNFDNMRIYKQQNSSGAEPVTSNTPRYRYADLTVDRLRNAIVCVREEHGADRIDVVNTIASVSLTRQGEGRVIETGNDFYVSPRLSPNGTSLAWITWNFPNMQWDGSELWKAELAEDGTIERKVKVAGGPQESVSQPEWGPDGSLYFISDVTGWWNIYRQCDGRVESMHAAKAEFGEPQWHLGISTYALGSRDLICAYIRDGSYKLAIINLENRKFEDVTLPFRAISNVRASGETAAFCASSPSRPTSIVKLDMATREWEVLRESNDARLNEAYFSIPREIEFPTRHRRKAYAFYYPPRNPDFRGRKGEKPPLVVKAHGGPTHAAAPTFDLQIQFFTSRGFAVLDVNYGGSTGYGREYRGRLNGTWGMIDVEDCANGAKHLCSRNLADRKKLFIRGGSAGGYTTLASLAFIKLYRAGACYYGISDLEAWAKDTHKFESRYLDMMIGPYPAQRKLYLKRSPARSARKISAPLILFQGLDDKVVPPSQSELIVKRIRKKFLAHYITFDGEGHGFHVAEHIRAALESEFAVYIKALATPTR